MNATLCAGSGRRASSVRIGNLISSLWFGAQPHMTPIFSEGEAMSAGGGEARQYTQHLAPRQGDDGDGSSFGALLVREGARRVTALPSACLDRLEQIWFAPENMHHFFVTPHRLYSTPLLTACGGAVMRQLSSDIGRRLHEFLHRPSRQLCGGTASHSNDDVDHDDSTMRIVVHYRVGDYLSLMGANGSTIDPRSVAQAARALARQELVPHTRRMPVSVELMDGGIEWLSASSTDLSLQSTAARSRLAHHRLRAALIDAFEEEEDLHVTVIGPIRRSADEDFVHVAKASHLVLAGGSFGLAAGLAGHHLHQHEVRLPACDHHLDIFNSRRSPRPVPLKGWAEYEVGVVRV